MDVAWARGDTKLRGMAYRDFPLPLKPPSESSHLFLGCTQLLLEQRKARLNSLKLFVLARKFPWCPW